MDRYVTRKIVESKTYQISSLEDGKLVPIKKITTKGRISEKKLEKELNIKKVVVNCIDEKTATYGMPVSEFMKYAIKIK